MKISLGIPLYNEESNVIELYERIIYALKKDFKKWKYEIIFVDDGSTDKTFELLKKLNKKNKNIKAIQFSRNFGHHIAITAALDYSTGDLIVLMDGDLQDRPEEIINLYKKLKAGYDIVYAERIDKKFSLFKKFNSILFNKIIKFLVNEDISINSTIFRIMNKDAKNNIIKLKEKNRYVIGIIGWIGFNSTSQKVKHDKRFSGNTKYSFSKQINLALNAIFSFSNYPLRLGTKVGIIVIILSFLLAIFALIRKFIYGTTLEGWTSILITILFLGGFQIFFIGIIGEYIGRIYIETKNRPLYIVKKYLNGKN